MPGTTTTLGQLARLVGGTLCGDEQIPLSGAAILRDARPGEITLADKADLAPLLAACPAAAVIVPASFTPEGRPYIIVNHVHRAFAQIVTHFRPPRAAARRGVHPGAIVSPTAVLGDDVEVHPGAMIADDVRIGSGSTIHSGVRILPGCTIGSHATIYPNAVLHEDTIVGDRVILHAGVILGSFGFGYDSSSGRHELSAQLGWVEIGDDVEIGANSTVDRGTYGATVIGAGTKVDNLCQVAHNCRIGRHNLICSQVGIAGSSTTGDYVVLAGQVGVRDHVHVGDRVQVGAKGGVRCDIPAGEKYIGIPAIPEREQAAILFALQRLPAMRKEFRRLQELVEKLAPAAEAKESNRDAA